jgi:hypothetical protein
MSRSASRPPQEALPYRVVVWNAAEHEPRILARALNAPLARAIFRAATAEHLEARITLYRGSRVIADSQAEPTGASPPVETGG